MIEDTPKNGRPSKFNEPIKEKICELIRQGETQEGVAIRCGITDRTLRRWLAKGAKAEEGEFADFYCKFQIAIQDSRKALLDKIDKGDWEIKREKDANGNVIRSTEIHRQFWHTAAWLLERRFPEQYNKSYNLNVNTDWRKELQEFGLDPESALDVAGRVFNLMKTHFNEILEMLDMMESQIELSQTTPLQELEN